jgi:two-component system LytT family response regulator
VETDSTPSCADLRRSLWPGAAIACTILFGLSLGYDASQRAAAGDPIPWLELVAGQAVDWYSSLAFVPALAWLTARLPVEGPRWPLALAVHLGAGWLLSTLKMALFFAAGEAAAAAGVPFTRFLAVDLDIQFVTIVGLACLAHLMRLKLRKALPRPAAPPEHFAVRDSGGFRLVRPHEILWADAQGNYARLHTPGGRHLIRSTMTALERTLDPGSFVRIHRRLIVNVDHVSRIDRHGPGTYRLHLADGSELRSARSYADRISRLLG